MLRCASSRDMRVEAAADRRMACTCCCGVVQHQERVSAGTKKDTKSGKESRVGELRLVYRCLRHAFNWLGADKGLSRKFSRRCVKNGSCEMSSRSPNEAHQKTKRRLQALQYEVVGLESCKIRLCELTDRALCSPVAWIAWHRTRTSQ